jgi:hypothetical protein
MSKQPNGRQRFAYFRAKSEIHADVRNGIVPKTVASFAELHDYVDANEYGGFCDEGPDTAWPWDGDDALWSLETQAEMNDVQNALDAWIKGRPFDWTTGAVDLGGDGGPWMAVWMDDNRWNGWLAAPYFDAYTTVSILEMVNEDPYEVNGISNYYGYDWHFEDDGTLVVMSRQFQAEEPDAQPERITPDEDGLYTVGSWGWVWSETWRDKQTVEDAETVDPVVMAYLPEGEE